MRIKRILDLTKAELAAKELLLNLGLDLKDPNYEGTPKRMVEVLAENLPLLSEKNQKVN